MIVPVLANQVTTVAW